MSVCICVYMCVYVCNCVRNDAVGLLQAQGQTAGDFGELYLAVFGPYLAVFGRIWPHLAAFGPNERCREPTCVYIYHV